MFFSNQKSTVPRFISSTILLGFEPTQRFRWSWPWYSMPFSDSTTASDGCRPVSSVRCQVVYVACSSQYFMSSHGCSSKCSTLSTISTSGEQLLRFSARSPIRHRCHCCSRFCTSCSFARELYIAEIINCFIRCCHPGT